MNFNYYKLADDFSIMPINRDELSAHIYDRLVVVEREIINEYLKKQEGKIGIKNLGNEIRYNEILKEEFTQIKNNQLLVKLTENRRSFIKVFLDKWIDNNFSEIFFLILEDNFGNPSNIVDSSFIRIYEIEDELKRFSEHFQKKTSGPKVYFIEIRGFDNYYILNDEGYASIHPKK